ncbi:MAG: long-chain fatty acid--CoA ligase [Candidatus Kapabacteria bacterium]|nr:long-chain fatty acid--CoA ligase [Candidatus Kapabacteria bacterium]
MRPSTIPAMFIQMCDKYAGRTDKSTYARKVKGQWESITHDQLRELVESFALGLMLEGVSAGERVGIVSENRIEWAIADFAISTIGAVDVPIFPTLTAKQEQYIYHNCEAAAIIVSNAFQLNKILKVRAELPALRRIIVMNDDVPLQDGVIRMSDVIAKGRASAHDSVRREKFLEMASRVHEDDLLTLIYTSGTTGNPKGVMLTHKNLMSNILAAQDTVQLYDRDVLLSYLPMCHSYERMSGYYLAFSVGASVYMAESIESVGENLREVRPTIMTSVPRLFERIKARVENAVEKEGGAKAKIFKWATGVGRAYVDAVERGGAGPILKIQHAMADKLVFSKIRERTGGRLRFFVSGGAALSVDVGKFFAMAGIHILEGYGLTETSPVLSINRLDDEQLGTVGQPLHNVEIRIAEDGEILARGPNIMKGYWRDQAATDEVISPDGWFHTGDIGEFTHDGRLRITDRKKHLLVSSGGKNIAPQPIEQLLTQSPLIDQALLIGNDREFCTALIVPDEEAVKAWATKHGYTMPSLAEAAASPELQQAIMADVNRLQRDLSKFERVRRITVLPTAFTVDNGMMTPTLKIKRKVVEKEYASQIDGMYAESIGDV